MGSASTRSKIMISLCSEGLEELRKAVLRDDLAGRNSGRHSELLVVQVPVAVVAGAVDGRFSVA